MPNTFFWYDLMTTDTAAAAKFYGDVVGWGTQASGALHHDYTLLTVPGQGGPQGVAGLMAVPPDKPGMPPCWMGYIQVDDVDAMAARIAAEGGTIHREPFDVPDIIRIAVVADPQGAAFLIAKPYPRDAPARPAPGTPGTIGWHELYATEWESAFAFYEKLFGWTKADAIPMGAMGTYQLFAAGGAPIGGMMTRTPQIPAPYWGYYHNVASVTAAAARITAGGGQVLMPPMEVPGGTWAMQAKDPQGAVFGLTSPQA